MPSKYNIHAKPAPPRFRPVGKLGIVDWREDCAGCHNCVKKSCVYKLFSDETDALREETSYLDYIYQCKGCLNCVQNCTKQILTRVVNPEYESLGDSYYTPEIILSTWYQAATGKIPVSGSGYGGPFSGYGFDSIWTDMSEIVRPTRDGIHGREYINTSVDIGRKPSFLAFKDGDLDIHIPPLVESPMPVIFEAPSVARRTGVVGEAIAKAALKIGLMPIVDSTNLPEGISRREKRIIPIVNGGEAAEISDLFNASIVMVNDCDDIVTVIDSIKQKKKDRIVGVRIRASALAIKRISDLTNQGADLIHLLFDQHGKEDAEKHPRHMSTFLRDLHRSLIEKGLRDQITIIASGGVALPEHLAKAILCGADLVAIDLPLLLALECRLCRECENDGLCSVDIDEIDPSYAHQQF